MGENSAIEWTDHTFNPWIGCQHVGPGCDHCYAEQQTPARVARAHGTELWGAHAQRQRTSPANWRKPLAWNREAAESGQRKRVFCASMADVFDNAVPREWRADLFNLIRATPNLDWLLLTKRIGNVAGMLPPGFTAAEWPNVWLGITVVNQLEAERDIPRLIRIDAVVRFLSIEPLLGPIYLGDLIIPFDCTICGHHGCGYERGEGEWECPECGLDDYSPGLIDAEPLVHWVIVGGESGAQARAMAPYWVRSLRDQCAARTPFFFKQWGEFAPADAIDGDYGKAKSVRFDDGNTVYRVGKTRAGRLLDGVIWNAYPESAP